MKRTGAQDIKAEEAQLAKVLEGEEYHKQHQNT